MNKKPQPHDINIEKLGRAIAAQMKERKLSYRKLETACGVKYPTLHHIVEADVLKNPDIKALAVPQPADRSLAGTGRWQRVAPRLAEGEVPLGLKDVEGFAEDQLVLCPGAHISGGVSNLSFSCRVISRATCTISSSDGVIRPESPTASAPASTAVSRIVSPGTITPRSITS